MKMHKVFNRDDQIIKSDIDARETKLEVTTKTLEHTRPANEQFVFNEPQYLAMIETIGFLNEKAEKEIANLTKITRLSKTEIAEIEQKAKMLKNNTTIPNVFLTEYRDDVKQVTQKYEMGIAKMKQLVTSKKSSLATITSKISEIKAINRDLTDKIQAIDKANLDINLFNNNKIADEDKKQIYFEFEQLLLNEKQKNAVFNRKLESLEIEHSSLDNKLVFLDQEFNKQKSEMDKTTTLRKHNLTIKKRAKEDLDLLNDQLDKQNEEVKELTSTITKNKEFLDNFSTTKVKTENQILALIKEIDELRNKGPSSAENYIKSQIDSYKTKSGDTNTEIQNLITELANLENIIEELKDNIEVKSDDIKVYMKDIDELEAKKVSGQEEIDSIRNEIRKLKRDLNGSDPIYTQICEVIEENKKHELELVDKYNQKKDQYRVAFQALKISLNDKLKATDIQIQTLKKLINDQLLKRQEKEVMLDKTTKQPDFDWKKLNQLVEVKTRINKLRLSIMSLKNNDIQTNNLTVKGTITELESKKTSLQSQIAELKRNAVVFEAQNRITYDVKSVDYTTKLNGLRDLIEKRKVNIDKLEGVLATVSNHSLLIHPEKSTMEDKLEKGYRRQIEIQSKEIEDLKNVLTEYSSN